MNINNNTHTIIKKDDASKYLTPLEIATLGVLIGKIADGRVSSGKNPFNSYYICNTDEPYANEVLQVILSGEEDKEIQDGISNDLAYMDKAGL